MNENEKWARWFIHVMGLSVAGVFVMAVVSDIFHDGPYRTPTSLFALMSMIIGAVFGHAVLKKVGEPKEPPDPNEKT